MRRGILYTLLVALLLGVIVLGLGAFYSIAREDPAKTIDHWSHSGGQSSPVYVTKSIEARPKEYVVDHKTHRIGQGPAQRPTSAERSLFASDITNIWCARTWSEVDAWGLPGFGKLFWGDIVIRLCWGYDSHGARVNRFFDWRETYTCGTKPMTLWTCDSTPDPDQIVKGAGTSTAPGHAGWRYRYRRAYWRFHYAYSGFPVSAKPFASITVRSDGSYVWSKGAS